MLEHALRYLELGYSVIPVSVSTKACILSTWLPYQKTAPTEEEVRSWWGQWPDAAIAVITGQASGGITVVDVDDTTTNWPESPLQKADLMLAAVALSGGGGKHFWFKEPKDLYGVTGRVGKIAKKIDIRNDRNYIVVPPSMHASGCRYAWAEGSEPCRASELPDMPEWLIEQILATTRATAKSIALGDTEYSSLLEGVGEGARNETAAKLAGRYLARGLTADEVLVILQDWNARNKPPMDNKELERTVRSIAERELLKSGQHPLVERLDDEIDDNYRTEALNAINEKFGTFITNISRIGGDEPYYEFAYRDNSVSSIKAEHMTRRNAWAEMTTAASRRMPNELEKKERWSYWANLMMAVAVEKEPGEDATMFGSLKAIVQEYLTHRVPVENGSVLTIEDPVMHGGRVWVKLNSLIHFVRHSYDSKMGLRELSQALTRYGCGHERITVGMEDGTNKRVRMYYMSSELLDSENE